MTLSKPPRAAPALRARPGHFPKRPTTPRPILPEQGPATIGIVPTVPSEVTPAQGQWHQLKLGHAPFPWTGCLPLWRPLDPAWWCSRSDATPSRSAARISGATRLRPIRIPGSSASSARLVPSRAPQQNLEPQLMRRDKPAADADPVELKRIGDRWIDTAEGTQTAGEAGLPHQLDGRR